MTGIGTEVGKTVVSAIIAEALGFDYWKPVESGESDSETVKKLISTKVHPPAYSFREPISPHHFEIDVSKIVPPKEPLVIEAAGGIFSPVTTKMRFFDLFSKWDGDWVIVSRHYLGSINHTQLTIHALQGARVLGIVFNGSGCEKPFSGVPVIGRITQEKEITKEVIKRYADTFRI